MNAPAGLFSPVDRWDQELLAQVRPSDWPTPTPKSRYDLVVIGGGTAGLSCAALAARLGSSVAIVERRLLGGETLNVGCVPSKSLVRAGRAVRAVRDAGLFGIRAGTPVVDFGALMERMRRVRATIAGRNAAVRLAGIGVDVFYGDATFIGADTIEVDGARLHFSRAVLATGSRPSIPPVAGLDTAGFHTNDTIFGLTELPARLVVLGGGSVGCELAQAFRRFGSEVTIITAEPRLLPSEDADAAAIVARRFGEEGIEMYFGENIDRVERKDGTRVLHHPGGPTRADVLLVATGRVPAFDALGLDVAGIAWDARGVQTDDMLRTTNARVYTAGDIGGRWQYTHAAEAMARLVVRNAMLPGSRTVDELVIPSCTFTDPEIARVGRHLGRTFRVDLSEVDRAVIDGDTEGFARVTVGRGGRIRGATFVARNAGELVGEAALAMSAGLGMEALELAVHPYPTTSGLYRQLADAWARGRVTRRARVLAQVWMRMAR